MDTFTAEGIEIRFNLLSITRCLPIGQSLPEISLAGYASSGPPIVFPRRGHPQEVGKCSLPSQRNVK